MKYTLKNELRSTLAAWLLALLLLIWINPLHAAATENKGNSSLVYSRAQDMRASASGWTVPHAHGGVDGPNEMRWSYYGVPAGATDFLSEKEWQPLVRSGRVDYHLSSGGDATTGSHQLSINREQLTYYWNRSGTQVNSAFAEKGWLLAVFTAPAAMTCKLTGHLTWRLSNANNSAGAAVGIAVLRTTGQGTVLFEQALEERGAPFTELREVPCFANNERLQGIKMAKGDRLVLALRGPAANHRGILLNDRELRIVTDCPAPRTEARPETVFKDAYFDSNGVKIHYIDGGSGVPVILIHGWAMNLKQNWLDSLVAEELAANFRVIAMDCRGMGKSEGPANPTPEKYGMEMVKDIVRLMDHLKLSRAHIVGFSMGAFITWRFQMSYPDRTISATHIDIPLPGVGDRGRQKVCEDAAKQYENGGDFQAAACQRGYDAWGVTDDEAKASAIPTMLLRKALAAGKKEDWPNAHSRIVPGLRLVYLPDAQSHFECFSGLEALRELRTFLADPSIGAKGK